MCRLIETIQLRNGVFQNLDLHMSRMERSRYELFHEEQPVDLTLTLSKLNIPRQGTWRCRITYARQIMGIAITPYLMRKISSLRIIHDDSLIYSYKYEDRSAFQSHLEKKGSADDILIVQQGFLTDTSFTNLILLKNGTWYTPARPLLDGTKREKLLQEGKIEAMNIREEELETFERVGLINAFLDPGMIEFPVDHILRK